MCTIDLLSAIGAAQDIYVQEACYHKVTHSARTVRFYLVAALIALFFLLAGCAAWLYKLEHLVIIDRTTEAVITVSESINSTEKEVNPGPYVAEQVLSLQGYDGSPAYNALQEWLAYETEYIIQHPEYRFQDDFRRPEAYEIYPCYTQEMVYKVNELCTKYGLHLMEKDSFLNEESKMKEYGLNCIFSPEAITRCFYGYLYKDSSFTADGELVLPGDNKRIVQFQMHNIKMPIWFGSDYRMIKHFWKLYVTALYFPNNDNTPDTSKRYLTFGNQIALNYFRNVLQKVSRGSGTSICSYLLRTSMTPSVPGPQWQEMVHPAVASMISPKFPYWCSSSFTV